MEENKLLEKMWSEAQSVEVPPELEPEQIRARMEKERGRASMKDKSEQKQKRFLRHGYGSRVAAAAIVLVASLGVYGVADSLGVLPVKSANEGMQLEGMVSSEGSVQAGDADRQNGEIIQNATDTASDQNEPEIVKTLGDYRLADSYEDVSEMLNKLAGERNYSLTDGGKFYYATEYGMLDGAVAEGVMTKEEAAEDLTSGAMQDTSANKESQQMTDRVDYSTTNLQVTGVDESDIVKTDGHYIYIATGDKVQIVDVSTGTPRQLGGIMPKLSGNMDRIREMYVADDRLILIVQTEDTDGIAPEDPVFYAKKEVMVDMAYALFSNSYHTQVLTYDITNPATAKLLGTFTQDGAYNTSRKISDQLYLFTDYGYPMVSLYRNYPDGRLDIMKEKQSVQAEEAQEIQDAKESGELSEEHVKSNLPKIQGETIPENCIYLPREETDHGLLIASVNVTEPEKVTDQKLIFSGYSTLYVTQDTILMYCPDYDPVNETDRTKLTKFTIRDGFIQADCAEAVPGSIQDTFAIHENKDGYLYILTTAYTADGVTNQLFVLDDRLKIHGKIEHIADGENVYAARFVDEIGYFVTYRNMDPLFTVDFSDPANPTLIGELEIPGFSDYLQFWDDTHLIGVGEERKEKDSEFVGIKVSLYDISDPTNVKESAKIVMDDACYAPAQYNYKALLADSGKNVIAFLTQDKGDTYQISQRIFTVQDGELKKAATDRISKEEWDYSTDSYRNLYIGDKLYLVREGLVIVYDMANGFERTATCKLT